MEGRLGRFHRNKQIQTGCRRSSVPDQIEVTPSLHRRRNDVQILLRHRRKPSDPTRHFIGHQALEAQQIVIRCDIHHLNVLGDDVVFQARQQAGRRARFHIQQDLFLQRVDEGLGHQPALGIAKGRPAAREFAQGLDVLSHLTVQEPDAVRSGEAKPTPKTEVENTDGRPQCGVFHRPIAVVFDAFHSLDLDEAGAQAGVDSMECERLHRAHGSRPRVSGQRPTGPSPHALRFAGGTVRAMVPGSCPCKNTARLSTPSMRRS